MSMSTSTNTTIMSTALREPQGPRDASTAAAADTSMDTTITGMSMDTTMAKKSTSLA
jgi:hypothetical protein